MVGEAKSEWGSVEETLRDSTSKFDGSRTLSANRSDSRRVLSATVLVFPEDRHSPPRRPDG